MATVVSITLTIGKGDAAHTRTITIDPDEVPLGFHEDVEAIDDKSRWKDLLQILADLLGLTHEEMRAVTNRQFREITTAIEEATTGATTSRQRPL